MYENFSKILANFLTMAAFIESSTEDEIEGEEFGDFGCAASLRTESAGYRHSLSPESKQQHHQHPSSSPPSPSSRNRNKYRKEKGPAVVGPSNSTFGGTLDVSNSYAAQHRVQMAAAHAASADYSVGPAFPAWGATRGEAFLPSSDTDEEEQEGLNRFLKRHGHHLHDKQRGYDTGETLSSTSFSEEETEAAAAVRDATPDSKISNTTAPATATATAPPATATGATGAATGAGASSAPAPASASAKAKATATATSTASPLFSGDDFSSSLDTDDSTDAGVGAGVDGHWGGGAGADEGGEMSATDASSVSEAQVRRRTGKQQQQQQSEAAASLLRENNRKKTAFLKEIKVMSTRVSAAEREVLSGLLASRESGARRDAERIKVQISTDARSLRDESSRLSSQLGKIRGSVAQFGRTLQGMSTSSVGCSR